MLLSLIRRKIKGIRLKCCQFYKGDKKMGHEGVRELKMESLEVKDGVVWSKVKKGVTHDLGGGDWRCKT